jgi:hypothetical protein
MVKYSMGTGIKHGIIYKGRQKFRNECLKVIYGVLSAAKALGTHRAGLFPLTPRKYII